MKVVNKVSKEHPVITWWSGGVTSAVACKIAIEFFGIENVEIIFMDTKNEHADTYRFLQDCERWYGKKIQIASRPEYKQIQDVWYKFLSLNVATGAICSSELKRDLRIQMLKTRPWSYNIFGFDIDEPKRVKGMAKNWSHIAPLFPLLFKGVTKKDCITILNNEGIEIPETYKLGFLNNNCFKTGCVQGGIGYWQKMRTDFPEKFDAMALVEHELTNLKGEPVTMLKDQSKKTPGLVFLKPHPAYPFLKDISMMKGRPPKPLTDCNGFCGVNDLTKNKTEKELNYQ